MLCYNCYLFAPFAFIVIRECFQVYCFSEWCLYGEREQGATVPRILAGPGLGPFLYTEMQGLSHLAFCQSFVEYRFGMFNLNCPVCTNSRTNILKQLFVKHLLLQMV